MMRRLVMLAAGAALAAPVQARQASPAQQAGPEPDPAPIVVEGRRDQDRQIRDLVAALPPASEDGYVARFEHAACPAVLGLSKDLAATVARRMAAVAAAAGAPVGKPGCAANVVVIVTPDKRALIEQLEKRFPAYVGALSSRDLDRLKQSPAPSALWHMRETVGSGGHDISPNPMDGVSYNRTTEAASRIVDLAHPTLTGAVLVVETRATTGLTTTQFADYAVMRTFTGVDPARLPAQSPATILKLLDTPVGGAAPVTLTAWDLAFMKSLYATNPTLHATGQLGDIRAQMRKRLERAAEPEKPR